MQNFDSPGAIITWFPGKNRIGFAELRNALSTAGLDPNLAKDMAPRNAFSRAAREMQENRVIDRIDDDAADAAGEIRFQFTGKQLSDGIQYYKECDLYLNKETGYVRCDIEELRSEATRLIAEHMVQRTPADVTRLVQRVFESQGGDLIPIRQQGGCYFVPVTHLALVNSVNIMLNEIGGNLNQWKIAPSVETDASISQNLCDYMGGLIEEFNESLKTIGESSTPAVVELRIERMGELYLKLNSYGNLLGSFSSEITKALSDSQQQLVRANDRRVAA